MATRKTGSRAAKKSGQPQRRTSTQAARGKPAKGKEGKARTRKAPGRAAPARKAPGRAAPARKTSGRSAGASRPTAATRSKPAARRPARKPERPKSSPGLRNLSPLVEDLRQEKAELIHQMGQFQAERDSALAEAGRLKQQLRELAEEGARHGAQGGRASGPVVFDPGVDLDEDDIGTDEDFDGTMGFFDRIEEIRARRIELDRERNDRELEQTSQPFWMICPKCGEGLDELENESIKMERCEGCGGLYLDRGEVDLLLSLVQDSDGIRRLHNVLRF